MGRCDTTDFAAAKARQRRRLNAPVEQRNRLLTPGRFPLVVAVLAQAAIVILVIVLFLTSGRGQH